MKNTLEQKRYWFSIFQAFYRERMSPEDYCLWHNYSPDKFHKWHELIYKCQFTGKIDMLTGMFREPPPAVSLSLRPDHSWHLPKGQLYNRKYIWPAILVKTEAEKVSAVSFCRRNGIPPSSLYGWCRRHHVEYSREKTMKSSSSHPEQQIELLPVQVKLPGANSADEKDSDDCRFGIFLKTGGYTVQIMKDFDKKTLGRILDFLGEKTC